MTRKTLLVLATVAGSIPSLVGPVVAGSVRMREAAASSIGLIRAIEFAEAELPGGAALEAQFESRGSAFVFEIEVLDATSLTVLVLDPVDGRVLSSRSTPKAEVTKRDELTEITELGSSAVDLKAAVGLAEEHSHGRAVEAGLEAGRRSTFYEIALLVEDGRAMVRVDPATGDIVRTRGQDEKEADDGPDHD